MLPVSGQRKNEVKIKVNQCQYYVVLKVVLPSASLSSEIQKAIILRLGDQIPKDHQHAYCVGSGCSWLPGHFFEVKDEKVCEKAVSHLPLTLLIAPLMHRRALPYSLRA
jgi:hypothetical protein